MKQDYRLAADAIQIAALICNETGVPARKLVKAFAWALANCGITDDDGGCLSCVNGQCTTGPQCVGCSNPPAPSE